jgi:hypothetical protein
MLKLSTIKKAEADEFIRAHHRHHQPSVGWKFGLAAYRGDILVGVAVVGRPVARMLDDGVTLEVTRLCTDGTRNAASFLYGAARRACCALGYTRLLTYTLESEPGTSLIAAGWKACHASSRSTWRS